MSRRAVGLWTCVCAVAWMAGCSVDTVMEPNVEAQFAKGGVKGKPGGDEGGGGTLPVLEEYWVYSELDGDVLVDYVHMVVKGGDADFIGKSVVYDHFFNGWKDDDPPVDQHYEFYFGGAPTPPAVSLGPEHPDLIHTDLPFHGERRVVDGVAYPYPNYYTTDVDGFGADPFAFKVAALKDGSVLAQWVPLGVIMNEVTMGPIAVDLKGAGHDMEHALVRSYATWLGDPPTGEIWVEALKLESNVRCSTGGGKGKKATSGGSAVVTGTIDVTFGRFPPVDVVPENPEWEYVWWEGHFYDVNTGALSARAVPASQDGGRWSFSLEMPSEWTGGEIAFVVDYLYPSASPSDTDPVRNSEIFANYAYNPDKNGVPTTAGHLGGLWSNSNLSTTVGDERHPLALSPSFPVVCK